MIRLMLAAAIAALSALPAGAAWWLEAEPVTGSNGLGRNSLTLFTVPVNNLTVGLNTAYYRDSGAYSHKTYSFRLPVMYSAPGYLISFRPFLYPVDGDIRSGAYGGRASVLTSLGEEQDESYLRLTLSAALAAQKARVLAAGVPAKKNFSQSALELQAEKSFYGQFYFLASAAAFAKPGGVSNATLVTPALDQADLAYLGTFRQITALPEWVMTAQVARNMKPEYDSYIYAGYSKISFRQADRANSLVGGIKLGLNEKASLDMAYNAFKAESAAWKSYYKLLLQLFF